MRSLLVIFIFLFSFTGFASSLDVSCSTTTYDAGYDFSISEDGKVTLLRGLYDGEFDLKLLSDGTFTSVNYKKIGKLHIIEGMLGPNVSMRLTYNSGLSIYVMNARADFLESDQDSIDLICESGAKL